MLASKAKKASPQSLPPPPPSPPAQLTPAVDVDDGQLKGVVENDGGKFFVENEEPTEAQAEEIEASNLLIANGNEPCDCIAYRLKNHRKNKCRWKKHLVLGAAAAVIVAGAVTAAVLLSEKKTATTDTTAEISSGVDQLSLNPPTLNAEEQHAAQEEEERRIHQEEEQRAVQERQREEREAQERVEAETARQLEERERQRVEEGHAASREAARQAVREAEREVQRLKEEQEERDRQDALLQQKIAFQNEQIRRQELENARLRRQAEEAQSARIYQQQIQINQNMHVQNNVSYQQTYRAPTYSTPVRVASRPIYGTTQSGTTCKNCIKQGGRCHQHR